MKFTFIDNEEETVIEISDEYCSPSYIDLELEDGEKDEDKTEESKETD